MQTDEKLILSLIQSKDQKREGFRLLVQSYEKPLYSVIRKMIIDHDETADLLQDTFIKIWEKLDSFKGDAQFYTWVYRIAINHCLQHLKKQKRRRMWSTGYEEEKIAQLQATPSISGDEIQLKLQKAILKLPDKQRLVFNLKYYEDMSYDQIARITNTTSGALRATYHHAVKKIEKMIQMDT